MTWAGQSRKASLRAPGCARKWQRPATKSGLGAIAILRRFGKSDYLRDITEQAIRGDAVLCIGASEESGGSDLQIVETEVVSARGGFEVRGTKKFVSMSPIADHIMVVARSVDHDRESRHGSVVVISVPTVRLNSR